MTIILPPFEYFSGHLSSKTGMEREGSVLLSAYIAFSLRQYFRLINLSFAVQNGSERVGGGPLKSVVYWEESGVSTVGDTDLALALPLTTCGPCYTHSRSLRLQSLIFQH